MCSVYTSEGVDTSGKTIK